MVVGWPNTTIRLMDKILHDPKDPKLWELWYIPYYGSCRILSINRSFGGLGCGLTRCPKLQTLRTYSLGNFGVSGVLEGSGTLYQCGSSYSKTQVQILQVPILDVSLILNSVRALIEPFAVTLFQLDCLGEASPRSVPPRVCTTEGAQSPRWAVCQTRFTFRVQGLRG